MLYPNINQRINPMCTNVIVIIVVRTGFEPVCISRVVLLRGPGTFSTLTPFRHLTICPLCWIRTNLLSLYSDVATSGDIRVKVFYLITLRVKFVVRTGIEPVIVQFTNLNHGYVSNTPPDYNTKIILFPNIYK